MPRLDQIEEDIRDLKDQFSRHEERHGDDADMLQLVLRDMNDHTANHHGTASTVKQGGAVGLGVTLLYVAVELVQRFLL